MTDKDFNLNRQTITDLAADIERYAVRYVIILFLFLLAGVYGFVLFKITALSSIQPSSSDVSAKVKTFAVPHIPSSAVQQMQSLQDHSVSVKALFEAARNNPFQE